MKTDKKPKKEIKELHEIFLKHPKISTNSKKVEEGDIFFALKGEKFDGNRFAREALDKGAHIAVVDDKKLNPIKEKRFFLVEDTLETLQDLGNYHRNYIGMPVIGITGSNGKTTTKELVNAVLSKKYNTHATYKNLNNHIGVPLTLLEFPDETDIGIVEMGSNHFGEIKKLAEIANPDFGIITSIGKAHLEHFKDEEGVKKEKGSLFDYLKQKGGIAFVNLDDEKVKELTKGMQTYGFSFKDHPEAQVKLKDISDGDNLKIQLNDREIQTKLTGKYNLSNIGYAVAAGKFFNLSDEEIKEALENYVPKDMRSEIIEKDGNLIILDAYNANPTSMEAALKNLEKLSGKRKIAILGDMFELGENSKEEHQKIAGSAKEKKIETYLIGEEFAKTGTSFPVFKDTSAFLEKHSLKDFAPATILIKGSRGMKMEELLKDNPDES